MIMVLGNVFSPAVLSFGEGCFDVLWFAGHWGLIFMAFRALVFKHQPQKPELGCILGPLLKTSYGFLLNPPCFARDS